jgi:hypothetical protein
MEGICHRNTLGNVGKRICFVYYLQIFERDWQVRYVEKGHEALPKYIGKEDSH